jgi:hypothetical protein
VCGVCGRRAEGERETTLPSLSRPLFVVSRKFCALGTVDRAANQPATPFVRGRRLTTPPPPTAVEPR